MGNYLTVRKQMYSYKSFKHKVEHKKFAFELYIYVEALVV